MLMDPRGEVHATTGILPAKAISIPPDQYAEALRNIEITFLTVPILTAQGAINLPLPDEPGHAWKWVSKENDVWSTESKIGKTSPEAKLSTQPVIREGWLKLERE